MKLEQAISSEAKRDLRVVAQSLPKGEMMSDADYALMLELERTWMAPAQAESDSEAR